MLAMLRYARSILVFFAVWGFILQVVVGSTGMGYLLCFGCEAAGWTIASTLSPQSGIDCCDSHCEAAELKAVEPEVPQSLAVGLYSDSDCECLVLALPGNVLSMTAVRLSIPDASVIEFDAPFHMVADCDGRNTLALRGVGYSPAGPESALSMRLPRSRCTVLVI